MGLVVAVFLIQSGSQIDIHNVKYTMSQLSVSQILPNLGLTITSSY